MYILSLADHLNLCRSCLYQLHQIRSIRCNLLFSTATTLLHSFVLGQLDYCNSILASLPKFQICQLQSVVNSAQSSDQLPKFFHISEYGRDMMQCTRLRRKNQIQDPVPGLDIDSHLLFQMYRTVACAGWCPVGRQSLCSEVPEEIYFSTRTASTVLHRSLPCL